MALYRKGAGQGLLFIGGSLAHDANCCCSACSDAVTVLCCLRGQSYPMGECECEEAGGFVVAEGSNCDGSGGDDDGGNGSCSSTMVDCCFNGEFLSLTACDCALIGGVANPATCPPIVEEGGCLISREIRIRSRTAPYRWGCLSNNTGNCGGATPNCAKPDGYPGTMCFPGCEVIGDCTVCSGGLYCIRFGSESYFKFRWEEGGIDTGPPGVSYIEEPGDVCGNPCCDNTPIHYPYRETVITQYYNVCPGAILRDTLTEIQSYSGAGCGSVDGTTLYQYDVSDVTPCVTPC